MRQFASGKYPQQQSSEPHGEIRDREKQDIKQKYRNSEYPQKHIRPQTEHGFREKLSRHQHDQRRDQRHENHAQSQRNSDTLQPRIKIIGHKDTINNHHHVIPYQNRGDIHSRIGNKKIYQLLRDTLIRLINLDPEFIGSHKGNFHSRKECR